MIENTYLGMKSSEHYRHQMEVDAAEWELEQQYEEDKDTHARMRRHVSDLRVGRRAISVVVMLIIMLPTILHLSTNTNSPTRSESALSAPSQDWSKVESSGSDAFPILDLRE